MNKFSQTLTSQERTFAMHENTALNPEDLKEIERFHTEALDSFSVPARDGSLASAYAEAASCRRSYERWLINTIEKNVDEGRDPSFLLEELEHLSDTDSTINRWGTRPQVGDIEYGIDAVVGPLERDNGDTGYLDLLDEAERGGDLCRIVERRFDDKHEAQSFVNSVRESFRKGDHTREIIDCDVRHGEAYPFVATVLESDGNWGHRKALAAERNRHVANALRQISRATTRDELNNHVCITKRYARDNMVLAENKTFDGGCVRNGHHSGRKVHLGFNYARFATVMNAIATKAEELGLQGFKTYTINDIPSERKPVDGDAMDVGCRVGEFIALETPAEVGPSLWELREKTWKPSLACTTRLEEAGSVGFVWRPWWAIASEASGWISSRAA
jgi:hypothetical protein